MRKIVPWLLVVCLGVAFAQEMTPEADKAYQAYLFEKQEADNVYKETLNKAKEKCVKALKKEQDALLVKKDLAGANKIQAKIDELSTTKKDSDKNFDLTKIVGFIWHYDRPDGEYIKLNKGNTSGSILVWWANKPFDATNKPDQTGTWTVDKKTGNIIISFPGRIWTVLSNNNENMTVKDALDITFNMIKQP